MSYKFIYKGEEYTYNPELEVPFYDFNTQKMTFGPQTLKEKLGMTNEESSACHAEGLLNELRGKREQLLKESDWAGSADLPQNVKDAWWPYRQALRDITNTYKSLDEVVWPDKPV